MIEALIFASVFTGGFCPGKICVVGTIKPGTQVRLIGKQICQGKVKANFNGEDEEGVIRPFKGSVIEGCTGAYTVAVVSKQVPKFEKVEIKARSTGHGANFLSYGKCAITDQPVVDEFGFFRIGKSTFFYGQGTCELGGCGNAPRIVFDLTNCQSKLMDCTFCT